MTMTNEQIESTEWAKRFKAECPSYYKDAIKLAARLECVTVEKRDDHSSKADYLWAVIPDCDGEFWLEGLPTKEATLEVCAQMGWPVCQEA